MKVKDFLKKYCVLMIVAAVFIVAICYFAIDQTKDVVSGKKVNGEDVVVSIKGFNITADDVYNEMMNSGYYGKNLLFTNYEKAVVLASGEITDDITSAAEVQAAYLITQYQSQYGDNYSDYLIPALAQAGLKNEDELVNYFEIQYLLEDFKLEHVSNHFDEYNKDYKLREVSHILVKCEDSDNPTEEEKNKMAEIEAAFKNGESFEDIAKNHSDDSSASNGGYLGFTYADDQTYVTEFHEGAMAAEFDKPTDWIKSDFGYHIILVKDVASDNEDAADYLADIIPNLELVIVRDLAKDLDIKFDSEEHEKIINDLMDYYLNED